MITARMLLLLLLACEETQKSEAGFSLSPTSLEFGPVPVGTEAELSFEINNDGGSALPLFSIALVEGSEVAWKLDRSSASEVPAGGSEVVTVTFAPDEVEAFLGRIQVRTEVGADYVDLGGEGGASTLDNDGDGYSPASGDCDDDRAEVNPGADEACDGRDNDCDGSEPASENDDDSDGWLVCEGDCDDGAASVYPGAPEVCDDADSDCDGVSNDRADSDGDGASVCDGDCNDAEAAEVPGGIEVCDELDNDCSGIADDIDDDADGFSVCAGDCDDTDPGSYPVYVDAAAGGGGDGSPGAPYDSLADGLAAVVAGCPTVLVEAGEYEESLSWSSGTLNLLASGEVLLKPPGGERALTVRGGSVSVEGFSFVGGSPSGDGGAVSVDGASFRATASRFEDNTCSGDGGAIAVSAGELTLADCTFEGNVAGDDGGAVSALSAVLAITDSAFTGNSAVRGGALQLESVSGLVGSSRIEGNEAANQGGGVEVIGGSGLLLTELALWSNAAAAGGGGISLVDIAAGDVFLRASSLLDNTAGGRGGGVAYSGSRAAGLAANLTVAGNRSASGGAGIDVDATDASALFVASNILLFNDGPFGLYADGSGASVAYSVVYGTSSGSDFEIGAAEDGGDNLTDNAELRGYSNDGDPTNDDLRLAAGSVCIDSGPLGGGPSGYDWSDTDGTRNDRGSTGGPL